MDLDRASATEFGQLRVVRGTPRADATSLTRVPVDEAAITLRLPPVPQHHRFAAPWRDGPVIGIAAAVIGVLLLLGPPEPTHAPASAPSASVVPSPSMRAEPVLASAAPGTLDLFVEPEDEDVEEIIIIDEDDDDVVILDDATEPPPRRRTKRSRRANTRNNRRSAARAAALAERHMQRRQYKTALRHARRAVRHAPRNPEYQLLLGDAYLLTKRRRSAKRAWRKAAAYGSAKAKDRLRV